jgi:predicted nucleic-acid-binding protein
LSNVVVRFLTGDDRRQFERTVQLFRQERVFITKSVVLETEWVLRRGYRQNPEKVIDALEALIDLPNVTCEDEAGVRQALAWQRAGVDFADALHLAASARAAGFVTFDRDMIKIAKGLRIAASIP